MSTPINQLPTNNQESSNEKELVNEILKEINENDTNQIPMKEPSSINENQVMNNIENDIVNNMPNENLHQPQPQINFPSELEESQNQYIPQQNMNFEPEPEPELTMLDRIRIQGREPLIVFVIVTLLGMFKPNISKIVTPMISRVSMLNNNFNLIMNILVGLIAGALFFILKNNM